MFCTAHTPPRPGHHRRPAPSRPPRSRTGKPCPQARSGLHRLGQHL